MYLVCTDAYSVQIGYTGATFSSRRFLPAHTWGVCNGATHRYIHVSVVPVPCSVMLPQHADVMSELPQRKNADLERKLGICYASVLLETADWTYFRYTLRYLHHVCARPFRAGGSDTGLAW